MLSIDDARLFLVTSVVPVKTILHRVLQACIRGPAKDWRCKTGRPKQTCLRTVEDDLLNFGHGDNGEWRRQGCTIGIDRFGDYLWRRLRLNYQAPERKVCLGLGFVSKSALWYHTEVYSPLNGSIYFKIHRKKIHKKYGPTLFSCLFLQICLFILLFYIV